MARAEGLRDELNKLLKSRSQLLDEVEALRGERTLLMAARSETAALGARREALMAELERLSGESKTLGSDIAGFSDQKSQLAVGFQRPRQKLPQAVEA